MIEKLMNRDINDLFSTVNEIIDHLNEKEKISTPIYPSNPHGVYFNNYCKASEEKKECVFISKAMQDGSLSTTFPTMAFCTTHDSYCCNKKDNEKLKLEVGKIYDDELNDRIFIYQEEWGIFKGVCFRTESIFRYNENGVMLLLAEDNRFLAQNLIKLSQKQHDWGFNENTTEI